MTFQLETLLVLWTVRLAIACYLVRLLLDLRSGRTGGSSKLHASVRWIWTCGCILYILHVVSAFGFHHQWSHSAAYRHTAEQTAAVTGIFWGGGLYINYAFTVFWIADLTAWWRFGTDFPYRSSRYFWTLHAIFAFMVVNATVVFGPPLWKWIAMLLAIIGLLTRLARTR